MSRRAEWARALAATAAPQDHRQQLAAAYAAADEHPEDSLARAALVTWGLAEFGDSPAQRRASRIEHHRLLDQLQARELRAVVEAQERVRAIGGSQ